jgi:hypothetical protein
MGRHDAGRAGTIPVGMVLAVGASGASGTASGRLNVCKKNRIKTS